MAQVPLNEVQSAGSQSDSCVSLLVPLTWNLPAGRKSNSTSAAGNLKPPPPPHNVNWMLFHFICTPTHVSDCTAIDGNHCKRPYPSTGAGGGSDPADNSSRQKKRETAAGFNKKNYYHTTRHKKRMSSLMQSNSLMCRSRR